MNIELAEIINSIPFTTVTAKDLLSYLNKTDPGFTLEKNLNRASTWLNSRGEKDAAIKIASFIIDENPNSKNYSFRGHLYLDNKDWSEASKDFSHAYALSRSNSELDNYFKLITHCNILEGKYFEALVLLDRLTDDGIEHPDSASKIDNTLFIKRMRELFKFIENNKKSINP